MRPTPSEHHVSAASVTRPRWSRGPVRIHVPARVSTRMDAWDSLAGRQASESRPLPRAMMMRIEVLDPGSGRKDTLHTRYAQSLARVGYHQDGESYLYKRGIPIYRT